MNRTGGFRKMFITIGKSNAGSWFSSCLALFQPLLKPLLWEEIHLWLRVLTIKESYICKLTKSLRRDPSFSYMHSLWGNRRRIINKNNKDNSALHIGLTVFGLFEAGVWKCDPAFTSNSYLGCMHSFHGAGVFEFVILLRVRKIGLPVI